MIKLLLIIIPFSIFFLTIHGKLVVRGNEHNHDSIKSHGKEDSQGGLDIKVHSGKSNDEQYDRAIAAIKGYLKKESTLLTGPLIEKILKHSRNPDPKAQKTKDLKRNSTTTLVESLYQGLAIKDDATSPVILERTKGIKSITSQLIKTLLCYANKNKIGIDDLTKSIKTQAKDPEIKNENKASAQPTIGLPDGSLMNAPKGESLHKTTKSAAHGIGSNLFTDFEAGRIPFFGAALKFLTEMYTDITSYSLVVKEDGRAVPEFCGKHRCLVYELLCRNDFYEVRRYEPFVGVSAKINGRDYLDSGLKEVCFRLFRYLSGENDQGKTYPLSLPILVEPPKILSCPKAQFLALLKGEAGPAVIVTFPHNFAAPLPKDPSITIHNIASRTVYVKMFGGYTVPSVWGSKSRQFAQILALKGQNVSINGLAFGLYNKPSEFINRHNEIYFDAPAGLDDIAYC